MKRCLLVILDDDYNEHYVEELNPEYETTIRCDGEIWVASRKPKGGDEFLMKWLYEEDDE